MYSPRSKTPKGKEREQSRPRSRLVNRLSRQIEFTPPASPTIKPESLPPLPDSIPPSPALGSREPHHPASPALSTASIASRPPDRASVRSPAQPATVEDYESDKEKAAEKKGSHDTAKESPSEDKIEAETPNAQPESSSEKASEDKAEPSKPEPEPSASDVSTEEPTPTPTETAKSEQTPDPEPSPAEKSSTAEGSSTPDPTPDSTATAVQSPKVEPSAPEGPRSPSVLSQSLPRASYPPSLVDPYTPPSAPGYPPYWHPNMSFAHGYPMIPPHGTPHYPPGFNGFNAPFAPYSSSPPLHRQSSMGSRGSNAGDFANMPGAPQQGIMGTSTANGTAVEDDAGDLLTRISAAIPDLHLLLNRYKETHGQLGLREELIRQAEAAQADALKRKEDYIDNLTRQLESATKQHAVESSKLRLEIGNLEEKSKELEERIGEAEKSKAEMEKVKGELEAQKAAVEKEKEELEKSTREEKERLLAEFEEWKKSADETFQAEKMALAVEFDRLQKEKGDADEAERAVVAEEHEKEKQKLEDGFADMRKELETKLGDAKKELDEALEKQRQSSEAWDAERQTLTKSLDEQRNLLTDQHSREKEELEKKTKAEKEELEKKTKAEKDALTAERDKLQKDWDEERNKFQTVIEEMKGVAGNFGAERDRMQKIIDGFGEIVDLKSKGDAHYTEAFSKLLSQIFDLSHTHFKHLSTRPPDTHLSLIPPSLPSFLGNTAATHHLRAAYVTHLISSRLTARIFTPFLFSLDSPTDTDTDTLFATMSAQLRARSPRKEALWRHQTLTTLFTGSDAKRRINAAASSIVEDIVTSITPFAEPSEEEGIRTAVRRIVKLAAETWRFARLERELISAHMPAVGAGSEEDSKEGFWTPQAFDPAEFPGSGSPTMSAVVSSIGPLDEKEGEGADRKVLLRLFPVVRRECRQKDWRDGEGGDEDQGCVYSHGLALYDDDPPVVSRLRGLRHAGLAGPVSSMDEKMLAPLPLSKASETSGTRSSKAVSRTSSRGPSRSSSRASRRKKDPVQEEKEISRKDSVINPEVLEEDGGKTTNTKQADSEKENKKDEGDTKSEDPAPADNETTEDSPNQPQEEAKGAEPAVAPAEEKKDKSPEATTEKDAEPANEASEVEPAKNPDASANTEADNATAASEEKKEETQPETPVAETTDANTKSESPETTEKGRERVQYLMVPRKIGSTPATVRPPSRASSTKGDETAGEEFSTAEAPAEQAPKVDEKSAEEEKGEKPAKDGGEVDEATESAVKATDETADSGKEPEKDTAKEDPKHDTLATEAPAETDDSKTEEKRDIPPTSSKPASVRSKRSVRSNSKAPSLSRPATPSAPAPAAPSEKAPSEKAPSEKAKSTRSSHSRPATPKDPAPETAKPDESSAPKYRMRSTPVDQRTASLKHTSQPASSRATSGGGSTSSRHPSPSTSSRQPQAPSSPTEASPGPAAASAVPPVVNRRGSGTVLRRSSTNGHARTHSNGQTQPQTQPDKPTTTTNNYNPRSGMAFDIPSPAYMSRSSSRHTTGSSGEDSTRSGRVSIGSRGTVTDTRSAAVKGLYTYTPVDEGGI